MIWEGPMRKRIIDQLPAELLSDENSWLDLERVACVEVTSEDTSHPIEAALITKTGDGWRAAHPGKQVIRLLFDEPQRIRRINLLFLEGEFSRTQEFVLSWRQKDQSLSRELLRQQFNFSPPETDREAEVYQTDLQNLTTLELSIVPDISGGYARASLARLRLA